jgi:hypothetical protein
VEAPVEVAPVAELTPAEEAALAGVPVAEVAAAAAADAQVAAAFGIARRA